jgi:hypothetical protein
MLNDEERLMRLAIMQPYFLPYIGYFQLIASVDQFIVYDNIKYTKKGWINRNRMLQNGSDVVFSLPLKKDSDSLGVGQRELAADFNRDKLINQFKGAYSKAPHFEETMHLMEKIVRFEGNNLFAYLHHSIIQICNYVGITTDIRVSSSIAIDHTLQGQEKVLALSRATDTKIYINPIGGMELYSKEVFQDKGIELKFIKSRPFEYKQFDESFVPWLSMVDVLMFNPSDRVRSWIKQNYELI